MEGDAGIAAAQVLPRWSAHIQVHIQVQQVHIMLVGLAALDHTIHGTDQLVRSANTVTDTSEMRQCNKNKPDPYLPITDERASKQSDCLKIIKLAAAAIQN